MSPIALGVPVRKDVTPSDANYQAARRDAGRDHLVAGLDRRC